ncbi:CAP domain-containing protein [Lentzea sp. NPDC006480]|uniref:CAP domain-containing protein n=1 Tax=Lentzea sp. NPDC006480 TaxID=3157176 RepID=UPI0033B3B9A7
MRTRAPERGKEIKSETPPKPKAATVHSKSYQSSKEDSVTWLVNEVRKTAGLAPLRTDEHLRTAARRHSADMAKWGYCAHESPDEVTPEQRMRAAGHTRPGGENVARGQRSPHAVMDAWMKSPGHRANILSPDFRTIGVGVDLSTSGPHWTQNFGY